MRLDGKVAVVTGGASGIGLATVHAFLAAGARVAAVDRDAADIPGALCLRGDVADPASVAAVHAAVRDALGPVTTLVTSAGISNGLSLADCSSEEWERIFRVNVSGTVWWIQAVLPAMEKGGAIVTVASQLAIAGGRGNAAYIASKGAIISLTRSLAVELAPRGIRVNTLAPGAIDTPMLRRSFGRAADPAQAQAASEARHAMKRLGRAEEIAKAALYLAGDAASFTTGVVLPVDGGWTAA